MSFLAALPEVAAAGAGEAAESGAETAGLAAESFQETASRASNFQQGQQDKDNTPKRTSIDLGTLFGSNRTQW